MSDIKYNQGEYVLYNEQVYFFDKYLNNTKALIIPIGSFEDSSGEDIKPKEVLIKYLEPYSIWT